MQRTCEGCFWAVLEDSGYSNYTVEGTEFSCILDKHPNGTFDRFYGEDKRLEYAASCPSYFPFPPLVIDVDKEVWSKYYGSYRDGLRKWDRLRGILDGAINPAKKWGKTGSLIW